MIDDPRWDHRQHYDKAFELMGQDRYPPAQVHALLALYRLLAEAAAR